MLRLLTCFEPHRIPVFILDYLSEPDAADEPEAPGTCGRPLPTRWSAAGR